MKKLALALVCSVALANAQFVSFGIVGGFPFNDVVKNDANGSSTSTNYTVGPAVQVNLPANFRFEADMLYRPYGLTENILILPGGEENIRISGSQFRVPLLLQYRFGHHLLKPYAEAGLSVDHLADVSATNTQSIYVIGVLKTYMNSGGIPGSGTGSLIHQTHAGIVAGGGVDTKIPLLRLSGEVRYTRQGEYFTSLSNVNQFEVLIGIHF